MRWGCFFPYFCLAKICKLCCAPVRKKEASPRLSCVSPVTSVCSQSAQCQCRSLSVFDGSSRPVSGKTHSRKRYSHIMSLFGLRFLISGSRAVHWRRFERRCSHLTIRDQRGRQNKAVLPTWPAAMAEDQRERQCAPWSACAAEGISSHQATATMPKKYKNLAGAGRHKGTGCYQPQISTASRTRGSPWVVLGPVAELARQLVTRQRVDREYRSGQLVGRRKLIAGFLAGSGSLCSFVPSPVSKMGRLRTSQLSGVHCEPLDMEKGCSEMEDDHRPSRRETGYQGHELSGLDGAGIRGWENLHGSLSAARRCGVDFEGLGCQGWLDPRRRVQTPPGEGTLQRGMRKGRVAATVRVKKVCVGRGGLSSRSGHHADDHLERSAEGRCAVVKVVRTEPQHTLERHNGAR